MDATALRVGEYIIFSIIFIISVIGNVLVCLVIYKTPRMRSARNSLIVNLAVADLAVALVCIPFDIVIKVYESPWPLGDAMCKVVWPSMTLVTTCSAATLTAISYDRYRAVVHPYKPNLTRAQTTVIISITWLVSLVIVIPFIVALRIIGGECDEMWFSQTARKSYTALLFVCQYALPVVVIGLAYTRIAVKLREQAFSSISKRNKVAPVAFACSTRTLETAEDRSGQDAALHRNMEVMEAFTERTKSPVLTIANVDRQKELMRQKRNAKVVRMMVTVFLMYVILLLPNQIIWMWIEFGSGLDYEHLDTLLTFSSMSIYISSCVNPFIYAGMNEEFRKGFLKVLKLSSDNNTL